MLQDIQKNDVREPSAKLVGGQLWIWKEPVNGHKYVMGIDVSRGDSEDFSCIEIIDFDEKEQVLEFVGKIPPDTLAEIAYKWGIMYSALCVIDLTGGMGVATARKLQEMGYENFTLMALTWQTNGNMTLELKKKFLALTSITNGFKLLPHLKNL
jgi:hypothetical protein